MADIKRLKSREAEIIEKLASKPRLNGQHLTDAVYCNTKAWGNGKLAALGKMPGFDEGTLLRMATGTALGNLLEQGEVSQLQTISPDDSSVGTIDIWMGTYPVEIKVTWQSSRKDVSENDHWLTQLGGYAARNLRPSVKSMKAELWVVHLGGDQGKKFCPKHGVPEQEFKRKHPDTGRQRLACPECFEFLADGNRNPCVRVHEIHWTRTELESLHRLLTWRLAHVKQTLEDPQWTLGNPPPAEWLYDFECRGCNVKDAIGCLGTDDLEEDLQGSILDAEREKVTA